MDFDEDEFDLKEILFKVLQMIMAVAVLVIAILDVSGVYHDKFHLFAYLLGLLLMINSLTFCRRSRIWAITECIAAIMIILLFSVSAL